MSKGMAASGIERWSVYSLAMTMTFYDGSGEALLVEADQLEQRNISPEATQEQRFQDQLTLKRAHDRASRTPSPAPPRAGRLAGLPGWR